MTAYRRSSRPNEGYRIAPILPAPWGRVGPWQTGFRSKRQAGQVEAWVREMALTRPDLVDALVRGAFSLREAWVAKLRGKLDDLLAGLTDPPLEVACRTFAPLAKDARVRAGLAHLPALAVAVEATRGRAGRALRVSWLLESVNVSELYALAERQGLASGTVLRSVHRAVADLLLHRMGKSRRNAALVDVPRPKPADRRDVRVTADELRRLLAACEPDFHDFVALAMLLAVDRTPLLMLTPRLFDETLGTVAVLDRKTESRPRTIELSTPALSVLRVRCAGRSADDRLFPWSPWQVRSAWETARDSAAGRSSRNRRERGMADPVGDAAGRLAKEQGIVTLPVLRFKDLRHLLPTAWNALALPPLDLDGIMGWAKGSHMRDRYTSTRIAGDREKLDRVAAFLGLDRLHVRAVG